MSLEYCVPWILNCEYWIHNLIEMYTEKKSIACNFCKFCSTGTMARSTVLSPSTKLKQKFQFFPTETQMTDDIHIHNTDSNGLHRIMDYSISDGSLHPSPSCQNPIVLLNLLFFIY